MYLGFAPPTPGGLSITSLPGTPLAEAEFSVAVSALRDSACLESTPMPSPKVRKGMPNPDLNRAEFEKRFLDQFQDPGFAELSPELERVTNAAWEAYSKGRKAPRTRKAGPQYANSDYDPSIDWIHAREAIHQAQRQYEDLQRPPRVLLINGSPRSEHTCPGRCPSHTACWRLHAKYLPRRLLSPSRNST